MDKELRPKITLHQVGAILLATIIGVSSIVILAAAIFGTVVP
jgi:hypothetical protein